MNLGEAIEVLRAEYLEDTAHPYLWSDEEVTRAFNWAETEASRRARLLVDSSTYTVTVATDGTAALAEAIIFVKRAKLVGADRPLVMALQADLDADVPAWEDAIGEPRYFVPNGDTGVLRVYPKPEAAIDAQLTVVRTPLVAMSADADEPEIPSRFHEALLHGAAYRCFSRPDGDTEDQTKAAAHLALFEQEFGPKSSAMDETWIRENYSFGSLQGVF